MAKFIIQIAEAPNKQLGTMGGWDFVQSDTQTTDEAVADVKQRYPHAEVLGVFMKIA